MEKQEFEKKMRNREIAFEKLMQRKLENLKKLRDCTSIEMKENHEVVLDKKHLEDEPSINNGKCKKHRETPSPKGSQVEKDIKSSNKKVEPEDHDTSTTNKLLEIQDYEMILPKEDVDKADKDDRDKIEDKGSGNKPKFREQDLLQSAQDKDDGGNLILTFEDCNKEEPTRENATSKEANGNKMNMDQSTSDGDYIIVDD